MYRTVIFESVKRIKTVTYKCTRCKKKRTKKVKTEHTINPFNKNNDGTIKNREQVSADVTIAHKKEVAEVEGGVICNKCKDEIVAEREAARKKI